MSQSQVQEHISSNWWIYVICALFALLMVGLFYAIGTDNEEFKAGIETLSCPEIKFLIQYGDFEHHGNEMILEVWVDKC